MYKKRHIFFGLMTVFAKEYLVLALMVIIRVSTMIIWLHRAIVHVVVRSSLHLQVPWVFSSCSSKFVGPLRVPSAHKLSLGILNQREMVPSSVPGSGLRGCSSARSSARPRCNTTS